MKLACDSCGSKYSIADDKVRGRTVKVRCPRCEELIVVRGQEVGAAPARSAANGEWLVVMGGEQAGPFDEQAIHELLAEGRLEGGSWCWQEGLEQWVSLAEAGLAGAPPDDGAFESAPPAADTVITTAPSATGLELTAARNDTSVLFSLADLSQLSRASEPVRAVEEAGVAQGDSSGLIDIRALACQNEGGLHEAAVDPMLVAGLAAAPPLATPMAPRTASRRGLVVAVGGAGASLAVVAAVLVVLLVHPGSADGGPEPSSAAADTPIIVQPLPTAETADEGSPSDRASGAETPEVVSTPETESTETEPTEGAAAETRRSSRRRRPRHVDGEATPRRAPSAPVDGAPSGPAPPRGRPSIEAMMERAVTSSETGLDGRGPAAAAEAPDALPQRLTTSQVARGMRRATGAVRRCARGHDDRVVVNVTISGATGRITNVSVAGPLRGTSEGTCVSRALQGLTFPRFRDSTLQVRRYPFVVR